jgi:hypothetical protein
MSKAKATHKGFVQVSDLDKAIMYALGCKSIGSSMRDIMRARDIYALDRKAINAIKSDRVGALNIALDSKYTIKQLNAQLKGAKTRNKDATKIAPIDCEKAQVIFVENFVKALPRKARALFDNCDTRDQCAKRIDELFAKYNARKGVKALSRVETI